MKKQLLLIAIIFLVSNLYSQTIERNGFIGITIGPSFPIADFANKSLTNNNGGPAKTGYCDTFINLGYLFSKHFGICSSICYNEYDIENTENNWWQLTCISIGPMYSLNLSKKFRFDLKPKIGWVFSNVITDSHLVDNNTGNGLGIDLRASIRYNIFRRWCILGEAGYLSSNQKFGDDSKRKIQAIVSGLGVAYRF